MTHPFITQALALFAAFTAGWGQPKLVAAWRWAPRGYFREMARLVGEVEALARAAILELAQTIMLRAFVPRGKRPRPAAAQERAPFAYGCRAPDPKTWLWWPQPWEEAPESWRVRFCMFPRLRAELAAPPVPPPAGRAKSRPYKLKFTDVFPEAGERGRSASVRGAPSPGLHAGQGRIRACWSSARQEAIDAYWRRPAGSPSPFAAAERKIAYASSWPMARRMEAARRALAAPERYARSTALRMRRAPERRSPPPAGPAPEPEPEQQKTTHVAAPKRPRPLQQE